MVSPIHPLNGQVLTVRHVTRLGGVRLILVEHPQGGTLTLPEAMLDLHPTPTAGSACLFDVSKLVALAHLVGQLKGRA